MAVPEAQIAVEREVYVAPPPEVVFEYFIDPDLLTRWQAVEADVDPRPGGHMRLNITGRDVASGEFVAVEPPGRIAFTWGWEGNEGVPPGSSHVEITLEPDGDGTRVLVRHTGLPDESAAAGHGKGWSHYLTRVAVAASGGDPGPDPWAADD
ncbi:MAG: SRPBCC family protein [Acidimicrobiia bacterium]